MKVSDLIKTHPGVQWVPIDELEEIRSQKIHPPLADDLAQRFVDGEALINPLDIWYDPEQGMIRLAVGNNRLTALARAGWTHAPCVVRRVYWGGFLGGRAVPGVATARMKTDLFSNRRPGRVPGTKRPVPINPYKPKFIGIHDPHDDQGWVLPSQVGLTGLEPEDVP
jgi:hypothetical protein